jgi:nucleotide-binding universal stress UspA family protein
MSEFSRIVVGLSLRELEDRSTLRFTSVAAEALGGERFHFLHVVEHREIPAAVLSEFPDLSSPAGDEARERASTVVRRHFQARAQVQAEVEVAAGSPLRLLLSRARDTDADLVIVGRRSQGRVVLPDMVARKAPCSVLVVPEAVDPRISRVLVPVDFSDHSRRALAIALAAARKLQLGSVACVHAYRVPLGYHKLGRTYEEFAAIMRRNAEESFAKMRSSVDPGGVKIEPSFVLDEHSAHAILEEVRTLGADLIVMGARGLTPGAAILLGSLTEKLLRESPVPLLAVKQKGEGMSFLKAFLQE